MFFATHLCLAAACIIALVSLGQGQDFYTTVSQGSETGFYYPIPVQYLPPGERDFRVDLSKYVKCPENLVAGLKVTVCDSSKPEVKLLDYFIVLIHRTGSLFGRGILKATVYCQEDASGVGPSLGQDLVGGLVVVPA